jgi:glyoxylase-like metal-dependent hydrolase (beta-lactamase superfamily II)
MFRKTLPIFWPCVIALLVMAVAVVVSAQTQQEKESPGKGSGDVILTSQLVKTGLYLISGGGGNSLLRLSANGLILVGGKLPDNYRALMSQVRRISRISDMSIRVLIVTDHHEDHTGNNAQFLAAGAQIIAQDNVKYNLTTYNPSSGKITPPTFTYNHDYTLRLGGVEVQLMHFGNAHTSGDTVVYFPNLKVVAVGDLFTPHTPDPDFSGGGSLVGWGPVLAQVLNLDFDVVVPSTGPPVTRADLETFKSKIETLVSRAAGLVKNGVTKDQLMAQLKTDDLGWRLSFTDDQLDGFYVELAKTKSDVARTASSQSGED